MRTSFRLRNITERTSLADGTQLAAGKFGPAVSTQYPLGTYIQDFEYAAGLGDLDEHNGRFCITPEYPDGTYAYFVTLDAAGEPEYPFTLGPTYYGVVPAGNTGPQSGHNVPGETVVTYEPTGSVDVAQATALTLYPNPATDFISIGIPSVDDMPGVITVRNLEGDVALQFDYITTNGDISVATLPAGAYTLETTCESGARFFGRFIKQ